MKLSSITKTFKVGSVDNAIKLLFCLPGEISEGFNPTMGENTEAMSSPGQSPNRGRTGAGPLMMNDGNDSL